MSGYYEGDAGVHILGPIACLVAHSNGLQCRRCINCHEFINEWNKNIPCPPDKPICSGCGRVIKGTVLSTSTGQFHLRCKGAKN